MSFDFARTPLAGEPVEDEAAEDLVVKIHRCALAGLCYGDARSWDLGQRLLANAVPAADVGPLFGQFYAFGRALIAAAERPLSCRPLPYAGHCAEEALVLSMLEMAQRGSPAAVIGAAGALVGVGDLGTVFIATQALARGLARCGLFVRSPITRR